MRVTDVRVDLTAGLFKITGSGSSAGTALRAVIGGAGHEFHAEMFHLGEDPNRGVRWAHRERG